jgi:NitT/TauT family transport system substrate-binding protein
MALTSLAKGALIAVAFGALAGGYIMFKDKLPHGKEGGSISGMMSGGTSEIPADGCIKVGLNTWGGFAGLHYMSGVRLEGSGGDKKIFSDPSSRLQKEFGVCIQYMVLDNITSSRETWKTGAVDLLWGTIDALPPEVGGLAEQEIMVLHQVDYSNGGDVVVVRRGISSVMDLKGKTIAVADMSPSMTLAFNTLDAGGLTLNDVKIIKVDAGPDAAAMFKSGQVDAAVVWSPDDQDCLTAQSGSKVLVSTKQASRIIADVLYVKKAFLNNNRAKLVKLVQAWMVGNGELKNDKAKRQSSAELMSQVFGAPLDFCKIAVENVDFTTYGDNRDFFGLTPGFHGVTGEAIYNRMTNVYRALGQIDSKIPNWRMITDATFLDEVGKGIESLPGQEAAQVATFEKATTQEQIAPAIASKPVTISFASGSSSLDENAKYIVDEKLVDLAKAFPTSRIRLEGNTDKVGSNASNVALSRARAQSLATYMSKEHGFDMDRFVVVGNGPNKPVCSDDSPECYARNRRTEFQILE